MVTSPAVVAGRCARSYRCAHVPKTETCSTFGRMAELTGPPIPASVPASELSRRSRDVRRRRRRLRHRRRLRRPRGRSRRRAGAAAGAGRGPRRHVEHVRRPLLPRRRHGGAAGDRPRGLRRRDVRLPGRRHARTPTRTRSAPTATGSVEHFDWLEALGFEFERSFFPGKAVIQPGTEGLMYTGNEKVWPFRDQAAPAPRGHKVPVPGRHRGHQARDGPAPRPGRGGRRRGPLRDRRDQPGRRRVRRRRRAWPGGGSRRPGWSAPARSCIAAGGFVMNADMVAEYTPALGVEAVHAGIDVRRRAGHPARRSPSAPSCEHMDAAVHHRAVLPAVAAGEGPDRQQARPAVRGRGLLPRAHVGLRDGAAGLGGVPHRRQRRTSSTRDAAGARSSTAGRRSRRWRQALGLPAGSLVATLARYNEHAARGEDPDFHKHARLARAAGPPARGAPTTSPSARRCTPASPSAGCATTRRRRGAARGRLGDPRPVRRRRLRRPTSPRTARATASGTQLGEGSFFGRRAGSGQPHGEGR